MPTRVRLNCPSCGIVETYNYDWPDDQSKEQKCPFCSELAEFISAELVPVKGKPMLIEPKEATEYGKVHEGSPEKTRKRRKE